MVRSRRAWREEAGSADRLPPGVKREQGDLVSEHRGGGSRVTGTRCWQNDPVGADATID